MSNMSDEYLLSKELYERKQFLQMDLENRAAEDIRPDMERSRKLECCLIELLNKSLRDPCLETKDLANTKIGEQDLIQFNRKLLRAAYSDEISRNLTEPELRGIISKSIHEEGAYNLARIQALDEKPREALILLRSALQNKDITPDEARFEPDFESIRRDPDFQALLDETYQD